MVFVVISFLYRVVRLLGLDSPDPLENPTDYTAIMQRDTENRLAWACYFIDLFMATGVDKNVCWNGAVPSIPLPSVQQPFMSQTSVRQYNLAEVENSGIVPAIMDLDLSSLSILIIRLRMTGLR